MHGTFLGFSSLPATIKPAVAEAVKALGGLDILVNCAGGAHRGRITETPDEMWERHFAAKPLGLIRMRRGSVPHLEKSDQARIINISGTRGREPGRNSAMAGPINLGTLNVTKAMTNEFGAKGLTVSAIAPRSTRNRRREELGSFTAMDHGISLEAAEKRLVEEVPRGIFIEAEDISDLAVFVASARARAISGTCSNVDGGRTRSI